MVNVAWFQIDPYLLFLFTVFLLRSHLGECISKAHFFRSLIVSCADSVRFT